MAGPGARSRAAWALAFLAASPLCAHAECTAWPGEPEPLPDVNASDPFAARWARLRRDELGGLALLLEASDPLEAQRVWLHAACLAPDDPELTAALARTDRPVVHRLAVQPSGDAVAIARRATLREALAVLDAPLRVAGPESAGESSAGFDFTSVDEQIAAAADHLDQARFEEAAALADLARGRLARFARGPEVTGRRVRIELLAATARIALGEEEEARGCVERALREQPDLELDPARSPPKLERLLKETRLRLEERSR